MKSSSILRNAYEFSTVQNANQRILSEREEKTVSLAFQLYDLEGTGVIRKEDAFKIFQSLGYKIAKEESMTLQLISNKNNGLINFDQFKEIFRNHMVRGSKIFLLKYCIE